MSSAATARGGLLAKEKAVAFTGQSALNAIMQGGGHE